MMVAGVFYFNAFIQPEAEIPKKEASSRPTILIMPIKASGLTDDQKGFANGVTESMISTLSRYQAIKVLSSSTSYHALEAKMLDEDVRDKFSVDYLVRGSMQVMLDRARLNLEITDLASEKVVVSKKTDFNMRDIFDVQDSLSADILSKLQINLSVGTSQGTDWVKNFKSMEDFTLMLNWRDEWRKFSENGYTNSLRMLDELRQVFPEEHPVIFNLEAWQLDQKLNFGISENKENDLKRLEYILNKSIELDPSMVDTLAARALIGLSHLNRNCEESVADIKKTEELGSTVDTFTIAMAVYARCGKSRKGIQAGRNALELVPNDIGWFITSNLAFRLYLDGQIDEIYKLIGNDIDAEDMGSWVLAIYAFLEQEKGNIAEAKAYLDRAKKNGFDRLRFERSFGKSNELKELTINGLLKLGNI